MENHIAWFLCKTMKKSKGVFELIARSSFGMVDQVSANLNIHDIIMQQP